MASLSSRSRVQPADIASWILVGFLVFGFLTATVVGGEKLLGTDPGTRLALTLLATVVVAVGMEPVQRRARSAAERILKHRPAEPYEVLSGFTRQVTEIGSPDELTSRMGRVLAEGTSAAAAEVWLLVQGRLQLAAAWPVDATVEPTQPSSSERDPPGIRSIAVVDEGRRLGVLRVRERPGHPLTDVELRLFAGLAAQAGLLLASAGLQSELAARVADLTVRERQLREARSQLVTASDAERRRLERDLHDGAQQLLVALSINLRLAHTLLNVDRDRASGLLEEQAISAEAAIGTLITLSRGLAPELLTDVGLSAALTAAAAASPIPVTVALPAAQRVPPELEAAVYFCASEALQNAVKHAGASQIDLRLDHDRDRICLTVSDNGSGDFGVKVAGTGLAGMRDRASSVGGFLEVMPRPGIGTTVRFTVSPRLDESRNGTP
jgi:signal transduction histidine kinase